MRQFETDADVPTLGQIHSEPGYVTAHCLGYRCSHSAPVTTAQAVILFGPAASSNVFRRALRCTKCGHRGAMITAVQTAPVWDGRSSTEATRLGLPMWCP